jgi:rRNA biogenesis protein RRP5
VLGQISQINVQDLAVALPNNLTGYASLTRISPTLTKIVEAVVEDSNDDDDDLPALRELFTVGQWVRAVVVDSTAASDRSKKKHIDLSLEPELVNAEIDKEDVLKHKLLQVSVTSIEDHGIIVSFGHATLTGFIKKSALGEYDLDNVREGQVFLACVEQRPKNNVVQLSLNLKPSRTPIGDVADISSLLPGDTVQYLVTEVGRAGSGGKILGMLDGIIDKYHTREASITENKIVYPAMKNLTLD